MSEIRKRLVALFMALMMIMPMNSLTVFAENSDNNHIRENVKRYTVLVLDTSSSSDFLQNGEIFYTADSAVTYVKGASKKFLEGVLKSDGENYVALVSYKSSATVLSDFSSNLNELENTIDTISASEQVRSIADGLDTASSLLNDVEGNVIKNVVLFSTGMTNNGSYSYTGKYDENTVGSRWHRTDTEIHLYAYANVAYESAKSLADQGCNVYSIGLFQTMENMPEYGTDVVELFKLTAKDIASSSEKYYEVDDVNKLEFVFGEVAEDVVVDPIDDNDPIIIIPGVMGSRLFNSNETFNDSTRIWDPVLPDNIISVDTLKALNILKNSVQGELFVRPCEEQHQFTDGGNSMTYGREYGAQNTYQNTVDTLCDRFPNRSIYVFSYDWRLSNKISAQRLNNEIQKIIKDTGAEKVDLLCHSMGGLVASSYYQQYSSENEVDKIITCGTPYEGAAKLLNSVITKELLDDGMKDFALNVLGGLSKDVKSSFDGVAELTPTKNYVAKLPMYRDSWQPFNYGDYELSYAKYSDICKEIFGADRYNNAAKFQNSLHADNNLNALLGYDKAYFSVGINHPTITSIKFQWSNTDIDEVFYESDLDYTTTGDGTVPYYSSTISEAITKLDSSRWHTFDADHGQTITKGSSDSECLGWISDILEKGKSNISSDEVNSRPYTVIRIACPVDVVLTNGDESLIYNTEEESAKYETSFGRLDIVGEDDDIKMLCVFTDDDYKITLNGTDEGILNYAIRYYNEDDELVDERMFENVPLTENTIITTDADESEESVLHVDNNGDGIVDEVWTGESGEVIAFKDHAHEALDVVKENVKDATCTEVGSYELVEYCKICNIELSRKIVQLNALGHEYENGLCVRCGEVDPEYSPDHVHIPGAVVKENIIDATCTKDGSYDLVNYCNDCGSEITREHIVIKALGHKKDKAVVIHLKKPTCTKKGSYEKVIKCKICGVELSRVKVITPKLGHCWDSGVVVKKPSYSCKGIKTYTCTRCGKTKTVSIAKLPRISISNWTIKISQSKEKGFIVKVYCDGKIVNSKYYTVSYGKLVKGKKVTVTVKGTGKYKGTLKKTIKVKYKY